MNIYFVTGNENKFKEIQFLMPEVVWRNEFGPYEIQEFDALKVIRRKLSDVCEHYYHNLYLDLITDSYIVEDTSVYLDCLNGLPGPYVKDFLKRIGVDGLFDLAKKYDNNRAEARTIIGYSSTVGDAHYFEGVVHGKIVEPRERTAFGCEPIFVPDGSTKTFSEMTREEKSKISMRSIATHKLKAFLDTK